VALLKLSDWDPDVFYKFRDVILNQVPACGQKLRNDLCRNLPRVWANYFALDRAKDVAFEVGRFYYGIRDYQKALEFYHVSTVRRVARCKCIVLLRGMVHRDIGRLAVAGKKGPRGASHRAVNRPFLLWSSSSAGRRNATPLDPALSPLLRSTVCTFEMDPVPI